MSWVPGKQPAQRPKSSFPPKSSGFPSSSPSPSTGTGGRPTGISLIAGLMFAAALLSLCGDFVSVVLIPAGIFVGGPFGVAVNTLNSLFGLILSFASLFLALGLWTLKPWAFWGTIIVQGLAIFNIVFGSIGKLAILPSSACCCGIHLIPLLVIGYMLLNRNVRSSFGI